MNTPKKEVTIVIISHKSKKKVIKLINDISNELKIIIVENSQDKSIEKEILSFKKNVQLIFSKNNGYGSAINLARTRVTTKYFFVLNPDMQKIDDKLISVFYESAKELNLQKNQKMNQKNESKSKRKHEQKTNKKNNKEIEQLTVPYDDYTSSYTLQFLHLNTREKSKVDAYSYICPNRSLY